MHKTRVKQMCMHFRGNSRAYSQCSYLHTENIKIKKGEQKAPFFYFVKNSINRISTLLIVAMIAPHIAYTIAFAILLLNAKYTAIAINTKPITIKILLIVFKTLLILTPYFFSCLYSTFSPMAEKEVFVL